MKRFRLMTSHPLVGLVVTALGGALLTVPVMATSAQASVPQYSLQTNVTQAAETRLTAVDPYANAASSPDGLKPARPFWYSADKDGLTILRVDDNRVVYRIPYPATYDLALPEGDDFQSATAPSSGWQPVGITVSYPTEEQLASNSETPATNVFLVMKHSGYEWQSDANPPALRDPGQRDTIVPASSLDTDSSVLLQLDVTDPSFSPDVYPNGPTWAGALLGHDAGQPAFDSSTGNVYVPNLPSTSLPTLPKDLSSFVSVTMPIAVAENAAAEPPSGAPGDPPVVLCGPEHPDEGLLAGTPYVWPCTAEGGEGQLVWDFEGLPDWVKAHQDKLTHQLDGILYGTPPTDGTWTFTAKVTDLGEDGVLGTPDDLVSEPTTVTLNVTPTGVASEAEAGWEAGVAGGQAVLGTGTCEATATSSPGSMVPNWVDVVSMPSGCAVMGTAPISGEYYEFTLPNFHFAYPYDREAVIFSGSVAGTYGFDPLPQGVGLSGLAWHQVEKIHDPSTEADILNVEFIGVEPSTGQLYQVLPPQGSIEVNEGTGPPETSVEGDKISPITEPPLLDRLFADRPDIAAAVNNGTGLKVHFGDVAVEADRHIYVTASEITGPSGIIPIGGAPIAAGAVLAVQGGEVSTISTQGVQAKFLGLDANLAPAIPNVEPGQQDNGVLWVSGTTTGDVVAVDTHAKQVAQTLTVPTATSLGGVSVDYATRSAYVATTSMSSVAVIGTGAPEAQRAPTIWTGSTATFYVGQFASFPIATTGNPTATVSYEGTLPTGVDFVDQGNGMAAIEGTPAEGTGNDYAITLKATNGIQPDASFAVVLTVVSAPTITSADNTTFTVGCAGSFPLTINGAASLLYVTLSPNAPSWLTITQGEDIGTLTTLDGTPPGGSAGTYTFDITASTGVLPDAVQHFTLTVTDQGSCSLAPTVSTQPASQTVTAGQTATFTAAATGNPVPTTQWQLSTDSGTSWSNISGATSTSYTTPATNGTMSGYRYRAAFTNSVSTVYSSAATLTVTAPAGTAPSITTQPTNQTVAAGATATFTAAATGDPTPTVQWQRSTNGGSTWSDISGATGASYITPATTGSMNGYVFRAVFSNSVGTAATNAATLTVNTAPVVTGQPANQIVTEGQSATFTATASGNPTPAVQWQQSSNGTSWANVSGATSTSYTTPVTTTLMSGTQYRAVFTNSAGTATTNAATLTVNPRPTGPAITSQPASVTVTEGQIATFESTASATPAPSVRWQVLTVDAGATWTDIPGATATVYRTVATTLEMNGYQYRAVFTNSVGSVTSSAATLTVTARAVQLDVVTTSVPSAIVGQAYTYTLVAQGGTSPYAWALARRSNLPSGLRLSSTGVISGTPRQAGTYAFVVVVTDSAGHTAQATLTLTIARRP